MPGACLFGIMLYIYLAEHVLQDAVAHHDGIVDALQYAICGSSSRPPSANLVWLVAATG